MSTFINLALPNKVCPASPSGGVTQRRCTPQDRRPCIPTEFASGQGGKARPRGLGFLPGRVRPHCLGCPTSEDSLVQATRPLRAGCRDCHLELSALPQPTLPGANGEGGPLLLRSRRHPDCCAAVTPDENPNPLEELLLLPSSLSMNAQQHPRSCSYSGGRPNQKAASGPGSRCSGSAGLPVPLPLALLQPSGGIQAGPALRMERVPEFSVGPRLPPQRRGAQRPPASPHRRGLGTGHQSPDATLTDALSLRHASPRHASKPPARRSRAATAPAPAPAGDGSRLLRAHPALNRTWAAGARRPAVRRGEASWGEAEGPPRGAGAPPLTRGLWGSPWTGARPARIHA